MNRSTNPVPSVVGVCAFALLAALPAHAEESEAAADLVVGPPRVAQVSGVVARSREIRLSPTAVKSTTTFFAEAPADVATLVTVALPRLDAANADTDGLVRAKTTAPDFVGVTLTVDGAAVTPAADVRASLLGLDVTDRLKADGVPLNPWIVPKIDETLGKLAADKRTFYTAHGLAQWFEGGLGGFGWDATTTLHWMQTFPKGKPIAVAVDYAPYVGFGLVTTATVDRWASRPGCLDKADEAALRKALAARSNGTSGGATALGQRRLRLAMPADPIGSFRLVVDKPKAETLVVACFPRPRQTPTPTSVVFEAKDLTPTGDLDVVLVDLPATK